MSLSEICSGGQMSILKISTGGANIRTKNKLWGANVRIAFSTGGKCPLIDLVIGGQMSWGADVLESVCQCLC